MSNHQTILDGTEIAVAGGRRKLAEVIAEYDEKKENLEAALKSFEEAQHAMKVAHTVGGTWPMGSLDLGRVYLREAEALLLKSAWRHVYKEYDIERLASADDKNLISQMLEDPPAFTAENIFEHFGDLTANPRFTILRGLAEVFSKLDPVFKSHDKMRVGVKGLPKRVILSGIGGFHSYGHDYITSIINALAAVMGLPMVTNQEIDVLRKHGESMLEGGEYPDPYQNSYQRERNPKTVNIIARGIRLKQYQNGNGHLYFSPETLKAINLALAEFYGEVLPDCPEERPEKAQASTAVSKDLQYYPTPLKVVRQLFNRIEFDLTGMKVLEPSCGCGRFLDELRARGAQPYGVEFDAGRAETCRKRGHKVLCQNFLEMTPRRKFDLVIMNPPFYGRHYAKHVCHALQFLKPGGKLYAILPITARYDHGELDDLKPKWFDLPVGSFAESGTNINTTIAVISA